MPKEPITRMSLKIPVLFKAIDIQNCTMGELLLRILQKVLFNHLVRKLCILSGASCFRVGFFFTDFKQDMKMAGVDETKIRGVRQLYLVRDIEFSGESHRNSKGDNCRGILK